MAPLAPRTSVRVGGSAKFWVRPNDPKALVEVLAVLSNAGMPWLSLGGGANTIVGDRGVNGTVIRLGQDLAPEEVDSRGDSVVFTLGAGAAIARFLSLAREHHGIGVEIASPIAGERFDALAVCCGVDSLGPSHIGHLWFPVLKFLPESALPLMGCDGRQPFRNQKHSDRQSHAASLSRN